jgi:hypothetical protein
MSIIADDPRFRVTTLVIECWDIRCAQYFRRFWFLLFDAAPSAACSALIFTFTKREPALSRTARLPDARHALIRLPHCGLNSGAGHE